MLDDLLKKVNPSVRDRIDDIVKLLNPCSIPPNSKFIPDFNQLSFDLVSNKVLFNEKIRGDKPDNYFIVVPACILLLITNTLSTSLHNHKAYKIFSEALLGGRDKASFYIYLAQIQKRTSHNDWFTIEWSGKKRKDSRNEKTATAIFKSLIMYSDGPPRLLSEIRIKPLPRRKSKGVTPVRYLFPN